MLFATTPVVANKNGRFIEKNLWIPRKTQGCFHVNPEDIETKIPTELIDLELKKEKNFKKNGNNILVRPIGHISKKLFDEFGEVDPDCLLQVQHDFIANSPKKRTKTFVYYDPYFPFLEPVVRSSVTCFKSIEVDRIRNRFLHMLDESAVAKYFGDLDDKNFERYLLGVDESLTEGYLSNTFRGRDDGSSSLINGGIYEADYIVSPYTTHAQFIHEDEKALHGGVSNYHQIQTSNGILLKNGSNGTDVEYILQNYVKHPRSTYWKRYIYEHSIPLFRMLPITTEPIPKTKSVKPDSIKKLLTSINSIMEGID